MLQRIAREDVAQALDHEIYPGVPEAKHDHAGSSLDPKADDLTEIQIEGEQHALLARLFREHLIIGQAVQLLFAEIGRIVTSGA